jgi:hypothetical protein
MSHSILLEDEKSSHFSVDEFYILRLIYKIRRDIGLSKNPFQVFTTDNAEYLQNCSVGYIPFNKKFIIGVALKYPEYLEWKKLNLPLPHLPNSLEYVFKCKKILLDLDIVAYNKTQAEDIEKKFSLIYRKKHI